ncbi:MAG: ElyC/SanA/YdcF family protein [Pirellulaceae bacterium]
MKTGVLVHGCNLNAENWRHLAWGSTPDELGRIPQGLLAALEFQAEVIVFGTGASRKKYNFPGSAYTGSVLLESEYTREFLVTHFDDLLRFKPFADAVSTTSAVEWAERKQWFLERIYVDKKSSNTLSELREAGEVFLSRGCTQVVLVSSPTHLIRALRDAAVVYQHDARFQQFHSHLLAMPSFTCYEGSTPGDVVVVEPPHRPDRHVVPSHRRIARMMTLQQLDHDTLVEFLGELDELLQRYEDIRQNGRSSAP